MRNISNILDITDKNWNKDKIIRFLYVKLAPFFQRDLKFFLADDEVKLKMYMEGFKNNYPYVVCETLCKLYQEIFDLFNIESKIITTNTKFVAHHALIVSGDNGWYYIDPLKDLLANQLGLKTNFFGKTPIYNQNNEKTIDLEEKYPFLIRLSSEYIETLDRELNLLNGGMYMNDFFDMLHKEMASNQAKLFFELGHDQDELVYRKIEFMENYLINLGNITGLYERWQFYNFLFLCIFTKKERKLVDVDIVNSDSGYLIALNLFKEFGRTEMNYTEYKCNNGEYKLKKYKDKFRI